MAVEDGLAGFVAFDGGLCSFGDARAERPFCAAAGPDGDDGSVWGRASFQPVPGAVEEGCGCKKAVTVAGGGGDLALVCGCDGDGVHVVTFLALYRRILSARGAY